MFNTKKIILFFSLIIVYFTIIINKGIILVPDSEGYLNMAIYRSPIYPLFLSLISIFTSATSIVTIIIQNYLGLLSIWYLTSSIYKYYKLNITYIAVLFLILLSPYLHLHFVGNTIATEALAYPLYLFILTNIIAFINTYENKYLIRSYLFWIILLLTRFQFLHLAIIFFGISILAYIQVKKKRYLFLNLLLCLLIPFAVNITDKTYHLFKHQEFTSTPWTGLQVSTMPFFVCQQSDANYFKDPTEKEYFNLIFNALKKQHLNVNYLPQDIKVSNVIVYYHKYYATISNRIISDKGLAFFKKKELTPNECYIQVDHITKKIGKTLLLKNFKPWLKIYIKNVFIGFNTSLMFLLWIFILLNALYFYYKSDKNKSTFLIIIILCIATLLNTFTVASAEHTIKRFLFYNNWVLFFIISLLFTKNEKNVS